MLTTRTMTISPSQAVAISLMADRSAIGQHIPPIVGGYKIDPVAVDDTWDEWWPCWSAGEKQMWLVFLWVLYPQQSDLNVGHVFRLVDPVQQRVVADVIDAMAPQGMSA